MFFSIPLSPLWYPAHVSVIRSNHSIYAGVSNGHALINVTYPVPGYQYATALIQRDDGGFIIGGFGGSAGDSGQVLLGTDEFGNYEWNITVGRNATLRRLIPCSDGGYALLGSIWPEGSENDDWFLSRINGTLDLQWNMTYGGEGVDNPSGIVELEDGFMIGGTYTNTTRNDLDFWLIRTSANGTPLWNYTFGDSEDQRCSQMIQCGDGNFLLCGITWNPTERWDIWLVKTDSVGSILWNRTYSTPEYDFAQDIILLQDGGFAISGGISTGYEEDMLLLRIDTEGNQLWNKTFSRGADIEFRGYSLVETPDHGFCLRAMVSDLEPSRVFWLCRTDKDGTLLWEYQICQTTVYVYSMINAIGGGFVTVGMAGEYGTEERDFHLMLFPELSWVEVPVDQLWFTNVIPIPSYQFNASSAAPIQSWYVNDTHFTIDGSGVLTNTTLLNGTYFLHITVVDAVGNVLHANMKIVATEKTLPVVTTTPGPTPPPPIPPPPVHLILVFLAAALVIVLLLLCTKAIEIRNHMR